MALNLRASPGMSTAERSLSQSAPVDDLPLPRSDKTIAIADIIGGFSRWWIWSAVAWQDIKLRYRGSVLGPFWITLSTAVMALAMSVIFSRIFHQKMTSYFPYLETGLVVWQFLSSAINEGCTTFVGATGVIQQIPMPFSIQVYRTVLRNLIIFAHNFVVLLIVIWWFDVPIGWTVFEFIPGLFALSINAIWVAVLLGMISARFRDVPPIIGNFVQVLFWVTPIFWSADQLAHRKTLLELNPFFAAVDIVRAPLIGQSPAHYSWLIMLCMTVIGCGGTFWFFARFRARIAYWL